MSGVQEKVRRSRAYKGCSQANRLRRWSHRACHGRAAPGHAAAAGRRRPSRSSRAHQPVDNRRQSIDIWERSAWMFDEQSASTFATFSLGRLSMQTQTSGPQQDHTRASVTHYGEVECRAVPRAERLAELRHGRRAVHRQHGLDPAVALRRHPLQGDRAVEGGGRRGGGGKHAIDNRPCPTRSRSSIS